VRARFPSCNEPPLFPPAHRHSQRKMATGSNEPTRVLPAGEDSRVTPRGNRFFLRSQRSSSRSQRAPSSALPPPPSPHVPRPRCASINLPRLPARHTCRRVSIVEVVIARARKEIASRDDVIVTNEMLSLSLLERERERERERDF
jgi:hypothetical protein